MSALISNATHRLPAAAPLGTGVVFSPNGFDQSAAEDFFRSFAPVYVTLMAGYLISIFGIQRLMRDRKPFALKTPLYLWNGLMTLFATIGFAAMAPVVAETILTKGIQHTYSMEFLRSETAGYFLFLWSMSKLAEFGDTIFIVLRKRPLQLHHWWHHISSAWVGLAVFYEPNPFAVWFPIVNYPVHVVMYGYFTLRSFNFKLSPFVAQCITASQLVQFAVWEAVFGHVALLAAFASKPPVYSFWSLVIVEFVINTLFALWIRFYYESYVREGGAKYSADGKAKKTVKSD